MRYRFSKDASFHPRSNFYTSILRLEFYQVGQFKDYRFLLILIWFLLADVRLFSDAPHCRFRPLIPKVCVMGFLKDASFYPQSNFCSSILRLEFYQVEQFKDYRFLLILISFLLAGPWLFSAVCLPIG